MAFIKFARTVACRAKPEEEEEEEEEEVPGGGAEGDDQHDKPSREEAARRIAGREERRQAEARATQEREAERREREDLRRFREDAEPKLKLVERLGEVFGGEKKDAPDPDPPDPYDPDYARKHKKWLRDVIQKERAAVLEEARTGIFAEQERRQTEGREMARKRANDDLAGSFFDDDIDGQPNPRAKWTQEKRSQLLIFAAQRIRPSGPHGNFTQEDLEIAEGRLFREEVLARAEARGEDKIMGHLGAPRKPVRKSAGVKRTPDEIDAAAIDFFDKHIDGKSQGRQIAALERLEREDPEVYNYYIQELESAKDSEEDE